MVQVPDVKFKLTYYARNEIEAAGLVYASEGPFGEEIDTGGEQGIAVVPVVDDYNPKGDVAPGTTILCTLGWDIIFVEVEKQKLSNSRLRF